MSTVVRDEFPFRTGGLLRWRRGLLLIATLLGSVAAHARCTIERLPDIAVTMEGTVPLVHAQINGRDALFIADSGAFFSMVTPGAAAQFQLSTDWRYGRGAIRGVGGEESAEVVRARSFSIMGMTLPDVDFIVAGNRLHGASGLLGQNVFRLGDVEYDLANGLIRIVRPKDCKNSALAYWAAAANKPYSVIDIDPATPQQPHTIGVAYLNGTRIHVLFDTGAARSILTMSAARRAGITPDSPGVQPGGNQGGVGNKVAKTWIARFASFRLGDEEIDHARLRFADIMVANADMLIGADFFLSHRIYVGTSQRKLYFTYNGGPVFDLEMTRETTEATDTAALPAGAAIAGATAAGTAGAAPGAAEEGQAASPGEGAAPPAAGSSSSANPIAPHADTRLNEPTDAAGFARRGAAYSARHDYAAALADLTRACALAPTEASYFHQRGMIHLSNRQPELALADLDHAIKLKPDDVTSLVARGAVRAALHDAAAARADLEAASRAAAADSDERLQIASIEESLDDPGAAADQLSKWIETHPHGDSRMANALNQRCWVRALGGQALNQALADCNGALRVSRTASYLDSRGLVYLRLGDYDKAIEDYDAALRINPRIAWSLYGRGIARLRKGQSTTGQADLAAATASQPKIAERAAKFGIVP